VIAVGNLNAGGTGKTPMVEYLVELLANQGSLAVLSRGYKRKSIGFKMASDSSTAIDIGDEPMQFKKKFPHLKVAVDANRNRGITALKNQFPELSVVILDDAIQHRYVKAGFTILLTDYSKLFCNDFLLPTGSLREFPSGKKRADVIVVTKSPAAISEDEKKQIVKKIEPLPSQNVYFTHILYGNLQPIFDKNLNCSIAKESTVLLFCGIANPSALIQHLNSKYEDLRTLRFQDHHNFDDQDLKHIKDTFLSINSKNKIIVTTEKDAMRLKSVQLSDNIKNLPLFYIPIKTAFSVEEGMEFNQQILSYARANKKHDGLH
jgi:tetraacyldisaccharide 4'-kinase